MVALPCIATNVNGLRNLIDHGRDGLLVAAADPVVLQAAITAVLDDPDLARRLGENALERVRNDSTSMLRLTGWRSSIGKC